jgi:ATP-dependent DNA helicase RecG
MWGGQDAGGLLALLVAVEAGGQGVMMAPTEILARQHLESLRRWPPRPACGWRS